MKYFYPTTKHVFSKLKLVTLIFLLGMPMSSIAKASAPEVLQGNKKQIAGKVTDHHGEPLAGATVLVKETREGAVADIDGQFTIQVASGNTLVFSYVGHITQEIKVGNQSTIQVILKEDSHTLDELVVVGYGSMKRSEVATAITSIKPEEFNTGGAANRDVRSLLEGKVAGLTITRTGGSSPNSGVATQLRGVVSINGDTSPLIVIDGIPGGNLNLIQPGDIESIDVLKDGSAAAIYGSSANAGVILVTTKKGTKGATRFEYSGYMSHYQNYNKPDFMSADAYRSAMSSLGYQSSSYDKGSDTDMYDELIDKNNLSHSHSLSMSGGSESSNFRAALFYGDLSGVAKKNTREQLGGRFSLTSRAFNDIVTVQSNLSYIQEKMDRLGNDGWEAAMRWNPTNPIYNEDGTFYEEASTASDENKYARLYQQKSKRAETTTSFDGKLIIEPIKGLKGSVFGSLTRNAYDDNVYYNKDSRTSINSYDSGGYAYKYHYAKDKYALEPTIEYANLFDDKHSVSVIGGYSYRYEVWESFSANNSGFLNDATQENDLGAGSYLQDGKAGMGSNKEDETLISFFARGNYVYDNRYVIGASVRREGSSKFGDNNKWGNFFSVSTAWNISNEKFMEGLTEISNLKLRIGYGETGNSGISPYQSMATLGTGNPYLTDEGTWNQTYGPNKNPNPYLKWETKQEWNFGLDFGFLQNRIRGYLDYYIRTADDLLISGITAPQPANTHSSYTTNLGKISSSGIELTLNATPIVKRDFTWSTDVTLSKLFYNRLDKFNRESSDYIEYGSIGGWGALGNAVRLYEGDDIGNFYGKRFAGFDDDGNWLFYDSEDNVVTSGEITDKDLTVIGNGQPKWYLGFYNTVNYKNFDFTIGFNGRFGFDILNRQKMNYENVRTLKSGYNVLTTALTDGVDAEYQYSNYYLEKGNYLKLDNITIGYTVKKIPYVSSMRLYLTARDICYITGYSGETPELNDTGFSPSMGSTVSSPITRNFTFGLSVLF